ncbi:MAG: amidohydrolase family protein [Thermoleophilaceae bacterium]|nr:amidohydrolase family protein [Thermoleophilaceae bacterium]
MNTVDVHQHLWPEAVLEVLERRSGAPRARRRGGVWHVDLPGEPSFEIDPRDHDPGRRARELEVDLALVAPSAPVGVEALPDRDALAATAAWQEAAESLPEELGWWALAPAALPIEEQAAIAADAISNGAAGLCLAAGRLGSTASAESVLPLLAATAEAGVPVFVHPGPVTPSAAGAREPAWWAPATAYVAQQQAAWSAFHAVVRPQLGSLRAVFALLAGLAPLHGERIAARGGPAVAHDPLVFYDTSSYGPEAVRALAAAVGIGQLVHGSDFPVADRRPDVVERAFCGELAEVVRRDAPARALGFTWVPA